ncbi:mechanosensitive ion channel [Candidatus Nanohaloarchaea archaeon]|nr:mechanosensitive ion channel [Candidatus Nanohaloarchaea archaeon]
MSENTIVDMVLETVLLATSISIVKALVFLVFAGIAIRLSSDIIRKAASHKFSEPVVVDLITDSGRFLLWFWALLMTMSILGFSGLAASMGTAAGFVALGVSFALKNVISDTVAGAYLAQDPDFNSGDRVETDGSEGVIEDVGLRKTRLRLDNSNLRVLNNTDVEKKWTLLEE